MIYEAKSAAKAAKARAASKPRVQYHEAVAVEEPRSAPKRQAAVATGGKALKTGMVLARARLAGATSEIPATRDRQSALLGKGDYRDSEKVGREAAIGTLKTSDMPKLKNAKDRATYKAAMDSRRASTTSWPSSRRTRRRRCPRLRPCALTSALLC